jgi:uncharacterized protein (TIGR00255 family)
MDPIIKSMTGAGTARKANEEFDITIKVQSVNSRFLDVNIRLHHIYSQYEQLVRQTTRSLLGRGKVDINVDIRDLREDAINPVINQQVLDAYIHAITTLSKEEVVASDVRASAILSFPHAVKMEPRELENTEVFEKLLTETIEDAISDLIKARANEGEKLKNDIASRIEKSRKSLEEIEKYAGRIKEDYYTKIKERVIELMDQTELDEGRLEQEVAFLCDRSDITEEIVRLKAHFDRMFDFFQEKEPVGKKMDFLVQEMNREVNTIGSKSKNADISKYVIEIKSEVERIREQVQNIE